MDDLFLKKDTDLWYLTSLVVALDQIEGSMGAVSIPGCFAMVLVVCTLRSFARALLVTRDDRANAVLGNRLVLNGRQQVLQGRRQTHVLRTLIVHLPVSLIRRIVLRLAVHCCVHLGGALSALVDPFPSQKRRCEQDNSTVAFAA